CGAAAQRDRHHPRAAGTRRGHPQGRNRSGAQGALRIGARRCPCQGARARSQALGSGRTLGRAGAAVARSPRGARAQGRAAARMAPPDGAPTMPRFAEGEGRSPFGKGAPPYDAHEDDFEADSPRRSPARMPSFHELVRVAAALLVLLCIGGLAAWQWPALTLLYRWVRTPAVVEVEKEASPTTPRKIGDRLDPGGQQTQPQVAGGTAPGTPAGAAVAQRVVLYEEDPAEPQGKRFVGSAIWRTETISPGPGRSPELAVRADVQTPERQLAMD